MRIGANTTGWTVIDSSDGASMCAVSVRTPVRAGQRPQVQAVAEVPCADTDLPAEVQAVRELASLVDRRLPVLVTLARSQYRLRVMDEPAVSERELLSSLKWAVSADSDNPLEEQNLAWLPIPARAHATSRSRQGYAVITPTAPLMSRMAVWRQGGVKPKVVDIRETALRNLAGVVERAGECLALLSTDAEGVGMVFTHEGSLVLDRFIEQPMSEVHAADAGARARLHERIAVQLMRSIDVIGHAHPNMPVTRVLVGPASEASGLPEFLATQLPLKVEPFKLEQVFDLDEVPELAQSRVLQARCMVALGAALRGSKVNA